MPANKKQYTTPPPNPAAGESSSSQHLVQQTFHQHLREQIRSATQRVMEEIMREDLTLFLGAEWGECCAERKGYRNGSSTRDVVTSSGQIEDLEVPRDRAGEFHTQIFDQ
jgi:putative transposase